MVFSLSHVRTNNLGVPLSTYSASQIFCLLSFEKHLIATSKYDGQVFRSYIYYDMTMFLWLMAAFG